MGYSCFRSSKRRNKLAIDVNVEIKRRNYKIKKVVERLYRFMFKLYTTIEKCNTLVHDPVWIMGVSGRDVYHLKGQTGGKGVHRYEDVEQHPPPDSGREPA